MSHDFITGKWEIDGFELHSAWDLSHTSTGKRQPCTRKGMTRLVTDHDAQHSCCLAGGLWDAEHATKFVLHAIFHTCYTMGAEIKTGIIELKIMMTGTCILQPLCREDWLCSHAQSLKKE